MKKSLAAGFFLPLVVFSLIVSLFGGGVIAADVTIPRYLSSGWSDPPNVGDVDGDGDLEIISTSAFGSSWYAYHHDGAVAAGWPVTTSVHGKGRIVMYDIDGDGVDEFIAGQHGCADYRELGGNIYLYKGDGTRWTGWPKWLLDGRGTSGVVVCDLEDDGNPEIVIGVHNSKASDYSRYQVFRINSAGEYLGKGPLMAGQPVNVNTANFAVGDVGGDGNLEIVTPYKVFNADGTTYCSAPYTYADLSSPNDSNSNSSNLVVLGDLTGNGKNEVVYQGLDKLYVWDSSGNYLPGWPKTIHATTRSSGGIHHRLRVSEAVLGDLDGDGDLEIVTCSNDKTRLYAFHHNGTTVAGWPEEGKEFDLEEATGLDWDEVHYSLSACNLVSGGLVMGDIDGDGDQEIVYSIVATVSGGGSIFPDMWSTLYAFHHDGAEYLDGGFPKRMSPSGGAGGGFRNHLMGGATPLLADLDKDGDIEIVAQTDRNIHIFDLPGAYDPANIEWGRWRHDERNTACYEVILMIPGDANLDNVVNDEDASILAAHWQQPGGWSDGDFNGDNVVDDKDASILAAHWLQTGEGSTSPIPEPGTWVLLAGALLSLLVWRRR